VGAGRREREPRGQRGRSAFSSNDHAGKPFRRRQIAWPFRGAIGIANDAVLAPLVWATGEFGHGDAIFRKLRKPELKRLEKSNPFAGYALGARDVVVMVYGKSGTNWTLQIAHQLLQHGEAEFDHIHSFRGPVAGCEELPSVSSLRDPA
jgi:hypothetical protein